MKELFWLNEGSKVSGVSDERHLLGGCSYISEILLCIGDGIIRRTRSGGFCFPSHRVAQDAEQLQFFVRAFNLLRWIFIPSFGGILLGGLYLASKYGGGTFWIPAAPIATLAIMFVGGLITGRKMNQMKKTLGKADATFEALSARANDGLVTLSYGLHSGLAFGISCDPPLIAQCTGLICLTGSNRIVL
jgi:hypothetical protein